jgi:manganese-dependent inorganic pyrophosphatase
MIYVAGHKSPDTDSICAAIAYAELKKKLGQDAVACRLGDINSETKFILGKWGVAIPELLENASGKQLIIVDHSETKQGPTGIENAEILEIIDHHRIGDLAPTDPSKFINKKLGATCTIIYNLYLENNQEPDKNVKALILSAILSDTWMFKSSTTANEDRAIAEKISQDLGLDMEKYAMDMFKSKTDFHEKTAEQIMKNDYKIYEFSKGKSYINAYELVAGADELVKRKDEILQEMEKMKTEYTTVMFVIVDIMGEKTHMFVLSEFENQIAQEYKIEFKDHYSELKGLVSRKKQIVPVLEKIMN